mgnify:CR=1 FL=1
MVQFSFSNLFSTGPEPVHVPAGDLVAPPDVVVAVVYHVIIVASGHGLFYALQGVTFT